MDARIAVVAGVVAATLVGLGAPAVGNESAPPANNDFATAFAIAEAPFGESVDTTAATLELGEPQASCRRIDKTVWYRFTPAEDINLVAEATGGFQSVVAVYQGTYFGDLSEIVCAGGSARSQVEYRALSGNTYFIQVGSSRRSGGVMDFHLTPSHWQEKVLHRLDQAVEIEETGIAAITIDGQPRPTDPSMYDISVTVSDQQPITRGVLTFGLVTERIHQELARVPAQSTRVLMTLGYRYDADQYRCLSDGGEGQPCTAKSPIKDLNWLTGGEGSRAELILRLKAEKEGQILAERAITIPFAGQVAGIL
jgi:hypothetical protein